MPETSADQTESVDAPATSPKEDRPQTAPSPSPTSRVVDPSLTERKTDSPSEGSEEDKEHGTANDSEESGAKESGGSSPKTSPSNKANAASSINKKTMKGGERTKPGATRHDDHQSSEMSQPVNKVRVISPRPRTKGAGATRGNASTSKSRGVPAQEGDATTVQGNSDHSTVASQRRTEASHDKAGPAKAAARHEEAPHKTTTRARAGAGEEGQTHARSEKAAAPAKSTRNQENANTFYVGPGNNAQLVVDSLEAIGWQRTTDPDSFKLKWVQTKQQINYAAFIEGEQLVNHIPNCDILTNKLGLFGSLRDYDRATNSVRGSKLPKDMQLSSFYPETYRMDLRSDRDAFFQAFREGEVWICKPDGLNQGRGIYLVRDPEQFRAELDAKDEENKKQHVRRNGTRLIQRYIPNPLLIQKKKFDIRAYMLIASTKPFIALYHKGYIRLSCNEYDYNSDDLITHLTNQYIQKKDPRYTTIKDDTVMSMEDFNTYINDHVAADKNIEQDWLTNVFERRCREIMRHCVMASKGRLTRRVGFFDLYGFDFMIDADLNVWLIEINVNPSIITNCKSLAEVIPGVVAESISVAIECFEKNKRGQPLMPLSSVKALDVIYDEQNDHQTETRRTLEPKKAHVGPGAGKKGASDPAEKEQKELKDTGKHEPDAARPAPRDPAMRMLELRKVYLGGPPTKTAGAKEPHRLNEEASGRAPMQRARTFHGPRSPAGAARSPERTHLPKLKNTTRSYDA